MQGTWAEANPEVAQFSLRATRHLVQAREEMNSPVENSEGATVLSNLISAKSEIEQAIKSYLED